MTDKFNKVYSVSVELDEFLLLNETGGRTNNSIDRGPVVNVRRYEHERQLERVGR